MQPTAVPEYRYPQFCAVARAAEIVGERWTLLILRELFFGAARFSDLRRRLSEVSPSVLSERLANLEASGLITKTELEPPAASTVYELTEDGRAFGPALAALAQWGMRFLLPPRPGEQLDTDRFLFVLSQYVRTRPSPDLACELHVVDPDGIKDDLVVHLAGGYAGTTLSQEAKPSHVTLRGTPLELVGLLTGSVAADEAGAARVRIEGDASRIAHLSELFEIDPDLINSVSQPQRSKNEGEAT